MKIFSFVSFLKCMKINCIVLGLFFCLSMCLTSCTVPTESSTKFNKSNASICRMAFYNVENLFDTEDDPHTNDNDFLASGKLKWTEDRYKQKLQHIRDVMQGLNESHALALLGMAEVENKRVLEDLLQSDPTFQIIHYNSSDKRGIDACLLYNPAFFMPVSMYLSSSKTNDKNKGVFLREVLVVKGVLWKDTIHVLVNHWPSRREGEEASEHKRIAAATLNLRLIDSIFASNSSAPIFIMGDFNDQPHDESVKMISQPAPVDELNKQAVNSIINPFEEKQQEGEGTCKYKRDWFLFDQIMMSNSILDKKKLQFVSAEIYNPEWLYYKQDLKSGPFRTYLGNKYIGGYSDHFPVYIELKK